MSVPTQEQLSSLRLQQLTQAFSTLDLDHNGYLTLTEIITYFRSISEEVDSAAIQSVFERLDVNKDGKVEMEELVQGYEREVGDIAREVERGKGEVKGREEERGRLREMLEVAKKTERKNAWGVMEGSKLYVRIMEAQRLSSKSSKPSPFVEVMCERQRIQTSPIPNTRSPSWLENFEFAVSMGSGEVLFNVMSQGREVEFLGRASISLAELRDQQTEVRWLDLVDERGGETEGKLQVAVQWIHTETALLADQIAGLDRQIVNLQAEIIRLEGELARLGASPMGLFQKDTVFNRIEKALIVRMDHFTDTHLPVLLTQTVKSWEGLFQALLHLYLFLSTLACCCRSDFFNLVTAGIAIYQVWTNSWSKVGLRVILVCIAAAELLDCVWIAGNAECVLIDRKDADMVACRFATLVTVLNILFKVPIVGLGIKQLAKVDLELGGKGPFQPSGNRAVYQG